MDIQEWTELLDSTVTVVAGVEKRVGDCTPEEIETVLGDLGKHIRDREQELNSLRDFKKTRTQGDSQ
jgi:hypothetical protein